MNFEKLTRIIWKEILEKTIINYPEISDFCHYPYPDHPKGCPNIDKCYHLNIPDFRTIQEYAEFKHFYLLYAEFDFKQYKKIRMTENPDFFNTPRKVANLLYWQHSIKNLLSKKIEEIKAHNNNKEIYVFSCGAGMKLSFQKQVGSMENSCINVFSTMKLNGIEFEVKPKDKIVLCCLLCSLIPLVIIKEKQTNILNWDS